MKTIFLFILYLLVLVAQIAYLAVAIKRKKSSTWIGLFIFEILSVIFAAGLFAYSVRITSFGFVGDLIKSAVSILMLLSYMLTLFISACAKIVTFELDLKRQNKNYVNPFCLILATCFMFVGIFTSGYELLHNFDLEKTKGTVLTIEPWIELIQVSTIEYDVDDDKYEDKIITRNEKVGDKIDIYYHKYSSNYNLAYPINEKIVYIPSYIMGVCIIIFRLVNGFNKKEEKNIKNKKKEDAENEKK